MVTTGSSEARPCGTLPRVFRVALADKSPVIRDALRQAFDGDPRFSVAFAESSVSGFLERLTAPGADVDVAVLGWVMPDGDSRTILEAVREGRHSVRIVIYSGIGNPSLPGQVMALGGAGFCPKTESASHLLDVVDAVGSGRMVFPFVDIRQLQDSPLAQLTNRERDLVEVLATGATNAQLAKSLGVSVNTVKFHLGNLYDKLRVRNRAQAVALFLEARQGH